MRAAPIDDRVDALFSRGSAVDNGFRVLSCCRERECHAITLHLLLGRRERRRSIGRHVRAGIDRHAPRQASRLLREHGVVDLDARPLKGMDATLAQLCHRATCFSDASRALPEPSGNPPNVVILGLLMPGMDGFQLFDPTGAGTGEAA
jgi:hypothetical protein